MNADRGDGGFVYRERNAADVEARAKQQGGMYDQFTDPRFPTFKPHAGDNYFRVMPPTFDWDKWGRHYGIDIYVHSNVGPDHQQYLCLDKMKNERCPICDARADLMRDSDQEAADEIKVAKRVLLWIIDRREESAGPKLWSMSWSMDRDINSMSTDKRSGEVLRIDHPENGLDLEMERQGTGIGTKYVGLRLARRESPIHEDLPRQKEWLAFVQENPLPTVLNYYDADHIRKAMFGKAERRDDQLDRRPAERERVRDEPRDGDRGRDTGRDNTRGDDRPRERIRDEPTEPASTREPPFDNSRPSRGEEPRREDDRRPADTRADERGGGGQRRDDRRDPPPRTEDRSSSREREPERQSDRGRDAPVDRERVSDQRADDRPPVRERLGDRREERPAAADDQGASPPSSVSQAASRTRERLSDMKDDRR